MSCIQRCFFALVLQDGTSLLYLQYRSWAINWGLDRSGLVFTGDWAYRGFFSFSSRNNKHANTPNLSQQHNTQQLLSWLAHPNVAFCPVLLLASFNFSSSESGWWKTGGILLVPFLIILEILDGSGRQRTLLFFFSTDGKFPSCSPRKGVKGMLCINNSDTLFDIQLLSCCFFACLACLRRSYFFLFATACDAIRCFLGAWHVEGGGFKMGWWRLAGFWG